MKILHQIWVTYPGGKSYPLVEVISVINYYRDEVISTNLSLLEKTLQRLRNTSPEDVLYEIREKFVEPTWDVVKL